MPNRQKAIDVGLQVFSRKPQTLNMRGVVENVLLDGRHPKFLIRLANDNLEEFGRTQFAMKMKTARNEAVPIQQQEETKDSISGSSSDDDEVSDGENSGEEDVETDEEIAPIQPM